MRTIQALSAALVAGVSAAAAAASAALREIARWKSVVEIGNITVA
jgi:hypothetical protein